MSTRTSLLAAVNNNDLLTVKSLIRSGACDINIQNSGGDTPLHIAVQTRNIDILWCLLKHPTCDVKIRNSRGNTPLHTAVLRNDKEIVRCFLTSLTDCGINIKNDRGNTPLHLAVLYDNIEIVRCMYIHLTDCGVNVKNDRGYTPLHIAVLRNNKVIVRCFLIDVTTCDVNIQNSKGDTPLHIAVLHNNIDIISCLISRTECDINIKNDRGNTPLYLAIYHNNIDLVRCLISRTNTIQGNLDYEPLHKAVQESHLGIVKCLIENGIYDVNMKNPKGYSPFSTTEGLQSLHTLTTFQNVEWVHFLIQQKVDVLTNHVDNRLQLVEFILSKNDFQSLWFYIQNGLYINCLTSSGENIVHLLAKFCIDYLYIDFNFLFYYGLDFNLVNNDGNSPLMVASLLNNVPFIQFLAAYPFDVNRQNHQGHTALHLCVIGFTLIKERLTMIESYSVMNNVCEYYPRYLECIDTLLNLGADVNMKDKGGKTVVMLASMKNDRKLLETFINCEADVNIVDNNGSSALQYIDVTNNLHDLRCFNLLLSHGCRQSLNQPCPNGHTIIQNALKFMPFCPIGAMINFIKFLVFENVNLQFLTSDAEEIPCGQLFSSESRRELRQLLYLSGGSFVQITKIFNFEPEEIYEASLPETLRVKPREKFYLFANNLNLQEICRRVIRQNTGLAIHNRIVKLLDVEILTNFLLFKDDPKRFSLPVQLESLIDDDDDYNSYDLDTENDYYENDYLVYKDCKYLNEEHAGLKRFGRNSDSDSSSLMDSD